MRRVESLLEQLEKQWTSVRPRVFFHDITTKNVIINDRGELSGIVDLDSMAFGDPLLTVALTRTSLLSRGERPDYNRNAPSPVDPESLDRLLGILASYAS